MSTATQSAAIVLIPTGVDADAELSRLADEMLRLQPICERRELELSQACDAWKASRNGLSLDTPEGLASYVAAIDRFQTAADEVWAERDEIADRIRDPPPHALGGVLAKSRALRLELFGAEFDEPSWHAECFDAFVTELARIAGEA